MNRFHLPKKLRNKLDEKQIILNVSTGRSGTRFLKHVMAFIPGARSVHEPKPNFLEAMRACQTNPEIAYAFLIDKKLPQIAEEPEPIYIETSHLFCKGFAEPLLDLGIIPDIVILTRPPRQVARSICQLGDIPARSELGLIFYLSPEDPGVLPLPGWKNLTDYQISYWYCLEIKRRAEAYEKLFREKGARVSRISIEKLSTLRGYWQLLQELGVPKPRLRNWLRFIRNKRRRINAKKFRKSIYELPEDVDAQEEEVRWLAGLRQRPQRVPAYMNE